MYVYPHTLNITLSNPNPQQNQNEYNDRNMHVGSSIFCDQTLCAHVCMNDHICIYKYVYIKYIYVNVYAYIHIHKDINIYIYV